MMKRLFVTMMLLQSILIANATANFDFSMVVSSGQTLYFKFVTDSTVCITYPNYGYNGFQWAGYTKPSGSMDIPNTVIRNGITLRVTSIDMYAFYGCTDITSVSLPHGVSVNSNAFYNCSGLQTIYYNGASIMYISVAGGQGYSLNETNNNIQNIIIGANVKNIPQDAFMNCRKLKYITIGDSVENINSYAFSGSLDSVTCINYQAIACTTGNIFANCYRLTEINFGNNVKSIPWGMFKNCHNLTRLVIGNSITSIGYDAFENCNHLDTIYFNADSCLSMGYHSSSYPYTFYSPFEGCSGITTLIVGDNVKNIPTCAFYHCTNLSAINLLSSVPPLCDINSFSYTTRSNAIFNIQCHTREMYETEWSPYYNFVEPVSPSFTVDFSPEQTTNINLHDSLMGFAAYNAYGLRCDSSAVIVGTPYYGYKFIAWQDGNTDNPRSIAVNSDTLFTASFGKQMFKVFPYSTDTTLGVVSAPDSAIYHDTITVTAYPTYGYELFYWSYMDMNGNTIYINDNPANIVMTENIWLEALFTPMTLNVQFVAENNRGYIQEETWRQIGNYGGGPVYGWHPHSGSYHYGDSVRITANRQWGYRFKQWSDGCTENPRLLKLTQDTIITAQFDRDSAWIMVVSSDTTLGTVTGSGWYAIYDTAAIVAIATVHHHLAEWVVNISYSYSYYDPHSNPLNLYIENEGTVIARFAIDTHSVSVFSNDILHGSVEGGGEFEYGQPCTVSATAYSGYQFVRWSNGSTYNPYTFAVTTDMELTAVFIEEGSIYNVTATSANPTMGTVTGGGPYGVGEETVLTAIPNSGYMFDHWDDGLTINPRTITVLSDTAFVAFFAPTQSVTNIQKEDIRIYSRNGRIIVEGVDDESVRVFDMVGRCIGDFSQVLPAGVYLVKIGAYPSRKVVVMR